MVGQGHRYRSGDIDLDFDSFDEDTTSRRRDRYRRQQPDLADIFPENSLPMFLSDEADGPHPSEFITPRRKRRTFSISSLALLATCGAAAMAALYALVTSDMARGSLAKLDATTASILPAPSIAAQLAPPQPAPVDRSRDLAPPFKFDDRVPGPPSLTMAATTPSRDAIKAAYHDALGGMPHEAPPSVPTPVASSVAEPAPAVPAEPVRRLDPGEVAASLTRANALIASGDIAAARLVLRHPADFGDAQAAMAIAETYDPAFLQRLGVHGIAPNVAAAREWYEKARKFGAADAARRLEVLASR